MASTRISLRHTYRPGYHGSSPERLTGKVGNWIPLHVNNAGTNIYNRAVTYLILEKKNLMISRIWHGWTNPENADAYERLLKEEIFKNIGNRKIQGFKGIQLLKRKSGNEMEFITIMEFDTIESVKEFAGEDYEQAVVPEKARQLLKRFDERSQHYKIVEERKQTSL